MKSKDPKRVKQKDCSQLFCNREADRNVKFKKLPLRGLEKEVIPFCIEHANEKKKNDALTVVGTTPI
ncbi:MAG: hypothetical protein J07AB43_02890 [Candidatus Nanosalina sp. J07AB43]|jgi:hypothetical protein|nr:MAG: hypothetical protein J07AB43_02890 [Candidatus Nanosalina sp. J07AB43]